jgi:HK97 gp10 family phage protein
MAGVNLMPSWSVKIVGDTVTPKLAAFAGKIQHEVEMGLDVVGADMVDLSRSLVPVRTGFLRDSIFHRVAGFTLDFGAEADYASYVEFGTRMMGPRPFLRPALDGSSQKILDAILVGCMNALGV